ncbi:MAG: DNA primase [Cyclobacteriaceae bacterium]|nr:DNA primase [Cyclobacteriaceae bacterium]
MILRETIDEVKNRLDIIDVISDFITLKKSGQNYKALSPFTNEKTPSFFVVPSKGIFKDFSSGKGGDSFTFLMEHEGMSYTEAIRYLAKKYGVEIKETQATEDEAVQGDRESLYILMNFAKEYYKSNLTQTDEGKSIGLSYFRERGFNDKTIEKFELGYALGGWEHFSEEAVKKGYNRELLEKAGLVVKKEDGSSYDRFRGRVIFPVHNISGKVIAFGARMLGKEKNQPKYINSPETEIYHKSNVLYGLFQAKNPIRQNDNCYLVEGYTDVISLHQAGVDNVVASSGTALTEDQIKLIRRFSENVTVLFDGDAAGIKAALRGIDLILKGGLNVRVVLFPDGDDPDSYSRKVGSTAFQEFLKNNRKDFISFKADLYSAEAGSDPIRKAESIREIVTSIALIPDPVKRTVYIQQTSKILGIDETVLYSELNKLLIRDRTKRQEQRQVMEKEIRAQIPELVTSFSFNPSKVVEIQERETIRLLLNYSNKSLQGQFLGVLLLNELDDVSFVNPTYKKIFEEFLEAERDSRRLDSGYFMENGTPEVKELVSELMVLKYLPSPHWSDKYNIFFPKDDEELDKKAISNVMHLKYRMIQLWSESNLAQLKEAKTDAEVDQLLEKQESYKRADVALSEKLGIASGKY